MNTSQKVPVTQNRIYVIVGRSYTKAAEWAAEENLALREWTFLESEYDLSGELLIFKKYATINDKTYTRTGHTEAVKKIAYPE